MDKKQNVTTYISHGNLQRRSNRLLERLMNVLFRKVTFDDESLSNLQQHREGSRNVYVSFQNSNTSLLIFSNLLRREGFGLPVQAIGFKPYLFQVVTTFARKVFRFLADLAGKKSGEKISDEEYIRGLLKNDNGLIISLLSSRLFVRRYIEIKSDSLQSLVEIQKEMEEPILIFPQIMFWNRNPERTRTLAASRATGDRGLLSGFFTIIKSATPAFIRVPEPLNLKEEIAASPSDDSHHISRHVRNKILDMYNNEKRSILGPVIKTQHETMEKVLYHKNVLDEIHSQVEGQNASESKLRRKAYNYYREIAADFSIIYIRFFERSLHYVFSKIFNGIFYDLDDFRKLREASQKAPLILVPSHKSHMDYLIISSLFYQNKLIPPHILAGANLTFFPMGKIFRRSGAFFMRRSFKGLDLYAAVFKQYIKTLINEGYSIEFFMEGGRTRTGKLMPPRMGMLKYLIDAIEEGYNKDLMFVPVTINYDRILEENSYHSELKGKEKKEESTSRFFKSRKLLKRQYGSVYMNFGDPISYQDLKKDIGSVEDPTEEIAWSIIEAINEIVMITPFALTTAVILFSSARGFSRKVLLNNIQRLHRYLASINAPMAETVVSENSLEEVADRVINAYKMDGILKELNMEGIETSAKETLEDLYVINEEDRIKISFYRNTIIHYLLPLAYASVAFMKHEKGKSITLDSLRKDFNQLHQFFAEDFVPTAMMRTEDGGFEAILSFLESEKYITRSGNGCSIEDEKRESLRFFADILKDYLESYFTVLDAVVNSPKDRMGKKEFLTEVRKNGVKLIHLGTIRLMESISMANYTSCLKMLGSTGITVEESSGKKASDIIIKDRDKAGKYSDMIKGYLNHVEG